jgi:cell division protein FtsI/penicillin-binding protein 2
MPVVLVNFRHFLSSMQVQLFHLGSKASVLARKRISNWVTLYFLSVNSSSMPSFFLLSAMLLSPAACFGQTANADAMIARLMAGKPGAAVVLDVPSGKILARSNLKAAAQRVTLPGSVVKPFVLLELLQSGKIDSKQHIACRRTLAIAGRHMDCTHSPAITALDAADALAYSCNSYFAQAAVRLNPAELAQAFERAGFTSITGLAQDEGEAAGTVASAIDEPHLQLQALGYWGVKVTPLELVAAYRTLALHRLRDDLPAAAPVFAGLEASVQYGMAHEAAVAGFTVAGKTGTAAGATSQTHGFFVGYAPAGKPEVAVMIFLEHGRGSDAAAIAAPIFAAYAPAPRGASR